MVGLIGVVGEAKNAYRWALYLCLCTFGRLEGGIKRKVNAI